jgi:hypothetical protein
MSNGIMEMDCRNGRILELLYDLIVTIISLNKHVNY